MQYLADFATKPGETIEADICIVGSGAAGLSMAYSFINATRKTGQPLKVVVLESSYFNEPRKQDDKSPHRYEDHDAQKLYAGEMEGASWNPADEFFLRARIRCFGGTTNCWEGWTQPLSDEDYDRSRLNPLFKWPIGPKDLAPYYQRAMGFCSIGSWQVSHYNDLAFWKTEAGRYGDKQIDVLPLKDDRLRSRAIIRMGGIDYQSDDRLVNGSWNFQHIWGRCIRYDPTIVLYRNANVRVIESNDSKEIKDGKTVDRLKVSTLRGDKAGHDFYVKADRYVLAASCLENTRLLLHSDSIAKVAGKSLGYYLMTHPLINDAATFKMKVDLNEKVRNFYNDLGPVIMRADRTTLYPNVFAVLVPSPTSLKYGNFRAWMTFGSKKGDPGKVDFNFEIFPDQRRYVVLSRTGHKDAFGDPSATASLALMTEDIADTLKYGLDLIGKVLTDNDYVTDYKRITEPDLYYKTNCTGEHAMGTTRMSSEPKTGVVNTDCRLHNVDNLYVAGGSVFPTGGWANPTLTIIALAVRLADHLKAKFN